MLLIRQEQMAIFETIAMADFEKHMVDHLQRHFPDECQALRQEDLLKIIRDRIQDAQKLNFTSERDVCMYIDLTFALGPDFETNPEFPWAKRILSSKAIASPKQRMDLLYAETERQLGSHFQQQAVPKP